MDRRQRALRLLPSLVALTLLATFAFAQREAFAVSGIEIAFDRPPAWALVQAPAAGGPSTIIVADEAARAAIAIDLLVVDRDLALEIAALGGVATALEAWGGFSDDLPDARITSVADVVVAGRAGGRLEFSDDAVMGSVVVVLVDGALVTTVATAPVAHREALLAALDTVLARLEVRGPLAAAPDDAAQNPLLAAGSRAPSVQNPLLRGQAIPAPASVAVEALFVEPFTSLDTATVFGGVLDVGRTGAWTGALTGAAYQLSNVEDPTAVRYYFITDIDGFVASPSEARVAIDVTVEPGGDLAAAGLLFDYDPARGSYFAFGVSANGVTVLQSSEAGLELLGEQASDAVVAGAVNRLELRPSGTDLAVFVNDASVLTLQTTAPFSGGVGIIAIGSGTFTFRDLVIDGRE